jgi:PAS domain S-box-containing protein
MNRVETVREEIALLEREDRRTEEENRFLQRPCPVGEFVSLITPDYRYASVNSARAEAHRMSENEVIGKKVSVILGEETFEKIIRPQVDKCFRGEVVHYQSWFEFPDTGRRFWEVSYYPYREDGEGITHVMVITRDLTDRVNLENQLRQAQKMDVIGQLAGGVAHDFNNILLAVLGFTELAMSKISPEDRVHSLLQQVIKAQNRGVSLIRQLLSFSRTEKLLAENLDLNLIIGDMLKMVRRVIGEHIELKVESAEKLEAVHADRGQLEQILMNLCVNARDAMPQGGTITIGTGQNRFDSKFCRQYPWTTPGEYVSLSITDTGTGIPREMVDRIFEPFFTTKEAGKGTGLGLATVYGIVKNHKGMIAVETEVGQGTTFRIHLPVAAEGASNSIEVIREEPAPTGQETILVAEDDEQARDLARSILEEAGYRVFAAENGEEAIRLFEEHLGEIDMALLDAVMPRMSGLSVYEKISALRPETHVVFCSGYSREVAGLSSDKEDAIDFIPKPYGSRDLLKEVRRVFDRV